MHFWKDGLSVSESKVSIIILILIVGFAYILYKDFTNQIFSPLIADLLKGCLYSIAGINVAGSVTQILGPKYPTELNLPPEALDDESTI